MEEAYLIGGHIQLIGFLSHHRYIVNIMFLLGGGATAGLRGDLLKHLIDIHRGFSGAALGFDLLKYIKTSFDPDESP